MEAAPPPNPARASSRGPRKISVPSRALQGKANTGRRQRSRSKHGSRERARGGLSPLVRMVPVSLADDGAGTVDDLSLPSAFGTPERSESPVGNVFSEDDDGGSVWSVGDGYHTDEGDLDGLEVGVRGRFPAIPGDDDDSGSTPSFLESEPGLESRASADDSAIETVVRALLFCLCSVTSVQRGRFCDDHSWLLSPPMCLRCLRSCRCCQCVSTARVCVWALLDPGW